MSLPHAVLSLSGDQLPTDRAHIGKQSSAYSETRKQPAHSIANAAINRVV